MSLSVIHVEEGEFGTRMIAPTTEMVNHQRMLYRPRKRTRKATAWLYAALKRAWFVGRVGT